LVGSPGRQGDLRRLEQLEDHPDLVSTRLINDKVTLLHSRVWPSVVRVSDVLGVERLAAIHSEHTASGAHHSVEAAYPSWVPAATLLDATSLGVEEAFANLPACLRAQ
jgi:hypothetical protein